ncbi:ABC transporter permease, partial [Agrobacterium sp. BETTINA12B]|nr:ABC transporter permease [Agrobacterium sp. BETTINA12B]
MRFERREHRPLYLMILTPLLAVVAALALAGILIAIAGAPVLEAYRRILIGAFGSRLSATETLTRATPLMLTGLAAAVAFRARLWNIGAEGQFYLGAIAVAAFGSNMLAGLPAPILIPLLLVIGAVAGMVLILIPLWLRLRFSVDEVVTSLILNFIAVLFVSMLIDGALKDPTAFGWPQSQAVVDHAMLPKLIARSRLHIGFLIAIALAVVIYFVQSRTVFGMRSRAAGLNPSGAAFAGVRLG